MPKCDTTLEDKNINEEPLFGKHLTFHRLGLALTAVFALLATVISLFLMHKHATNYSRPWEQRHIIRILFMIPIYALVSFLSYVFYHHAVYYEVIRDCYEAFAIASFFTLMCHYLQPTLKEQKQYFRTVEPKNWVWPLPWFQKCAGGVEKGWLRRPRSGLTWFNVIWIGVFQYCFIRVFFTIVSVVTQATGTYCATSNHPAFAHVWTQVFNAMGVTLAMYCLVQFYVQLKDDLAIHKPFLKILSIKLVIFFVFWQTLLIDFLVTTNVLKPSKKIAYADIQVGIVSVLIVIEMTAFSVLHIFSFPYKGYKKGNPRGGDSKGGFMGLKAYGEAFNPWDFIKALSRGVRWLFVGRRVRHEDESYYPSDASSLGKMTSAGATSDYYNNTSYGKHDAADSMPLPTYGSSSSSHSQQQHYPDNSSPYTGPYAPQYNPDALSAQHPAPQSGSDPNREGMRPLLAHAEMPGSGAYDDRYEAYGSHQTQPSAQTGGQGGMYMAQSHDSAEQYMHPGAGTTQQQQQQQHRQDWI